MRLKQTKKPIRVSTCLTAARLVRVPRLLLSVMTMAWDSKLDEWYWGESDLLYTVMRNRLMNLD